MGGSEEESVQKRRIVEKWTDVRRSSCQRNSAKIAQENSQATVSEYKYALNVKEDAQVWRIVAHETNGEGE